MFFAMAPSSSIIFGGGTDFSGAFLDQILSIFFKLVDLGHMLLHSWQNETIVDLGGAQEWGVHQVHQESALQEEVEWDDSEDDSGELVEDVESTEADPVSEPLLVVIEAFGLEGHEAHESWVGNTDDVGDVGLTDAEHNQDHHADEGVLHERFDWNSTLLRKRIQNLHFSLVLFYLNLLITNQINSLIYFLSALSKQNWYN